MTPPVQSIATALPRLSYVVTVGLVVGVLVNLIAIGSAVHG